MFFVNKGDFQISYVKYIVQKNKKEVRDMLMEYLFILILSIVGVFVGLAIMLFLNIVMLLSLKEWLDKRKNNNLK